MPCIICHFPQEQDDILIPRVRTNTCICITCYYRTVGDARIMDKRLRREIEAVLTAV